MANLSLQATPPLKGYQQRFGNTSLHEVVDTSIYSIALALQPDAALASIRSKLGVDWPVTGQSTQNADASNRLLGLQSDQVFALVTGKASEAGLPELDESVYVTDQSDSWAGLVIDGPMSRTALERVCPIDLHPSVFPVGQVTRTTMEHLAVIILSDAENRFLLLSPASSAHSFLHAVETSLHNVY